MTDYGGPRAIIELTRKGMPPATHWLTNRQSFERGLNVLR